MAQVDPRMDETLIPPLRHFPALDSGALIICDHASNAILGYGTLGMSSKAIDRHRL
jgi:predicted N-formylglutamate amidohydrolase